MNWFRCIGGGGGESPIVFKNYAKFNGQGIILPWTINSDYKIECVFYEKEYINNTCITGSTGSWSNAPYLAAYSNRFDVGVIGSYASFGDWSAGEHTYINNDENNQSTLDGTASANYNPTTNSYFYTLGCRDGSTTGMGYQGYIKSFKIYSKSSGDLLHHLKPCAIAGVPAFCDIADGDTIYLGSGLQVVDSIPT